MFQLGKALRPFVAVLSILLMVTSSSAMAVAPLAGGPGKAPDPDFRARLNIEPSGTDGPDSRSEGRADFEDEFEMISPYPTNKNIYDADWNPITGIALLVGEQGLVMEYDGVYFNVKDSNGTTTFWDVTWNHEGTYALIGGDNGQLFIYNDGTFTRMYTGTTSAIIDMDFSPTENKALIVTDSSQVFMFEDLGDLGEFIYYLGEFTPVYFQAVAWHPSDGTALLAGWEIINSGNNWHWEGRVYEYDDATGGFSNLDLDVPTDRDTDLYAVDWSPEGDYALAAGWNGYTVRYDGDAFGTVATTSNGGTIGVIDINVKGDALLGGMWGSIYYYTSNTMNTIQTGNFETIYGISWNKDGSKGLIGGTSGTVGFFDPSTWTVKLVSVGGSTTFFDVAWRPDFSYALIVGQGGMVVKWDGQKLVTIGSPTQSTLLGIGWAPDGTSALIVGAGGTLLEYFDGGVGGQPSIVQRLSGTNVNLWDVQYNDFGQALIVGDSGEVRTWNGQFASKVVSLNNNALRGVDWKDTTYAYIVGDGETVLRYQTSPVARIDAALPNINANLALWAGVWEDDMERGLIVGQQGRLLEHLENNQLTTLDDGYTDIETGTDANLMDTEWNYQETDLLSVGTGGTAVNFHNEDDTVRVLQAPVTSALYGVSWKGNQYALIVGASGTVMKYWPNLKPAAVVLNSPTEITDNSMKLAWSRSGIEDFHHYEVHMSKTAGFTPSSYTRVKTLTDQDTTSYVVTGLSRDTTYYFKIKVADKGGLSSTSNEVFGRTIIGKLPPAAVMLYDPEDITDSTMTLKWSQNKDVDFDHYELHMAKTKGFIPTGSTLKTTVNDQLQTDTAAQGLQVETTYYFKLRVVDKDGLTNDSNEVSGTTQKVNVEPTPVTVNEPFNVTDDSMEVNWSENGDSDFKTYEVHMGTEEGFNISTSTRKATITTKNETAYKFTDLVPETAYYIKVRVTDTGGLASDSNEVSATTKAFNPPPKPVTLEEPVEITEVSMRLNWSKGNESDFARYEVHMSTTSGFEPNESTKIDEISSQNLTTYKVIGLTPGQTYVFKVRIVDTIGQLADSNEVVGTTVGNAPPKAVHLEVTSVDKTAIGLMWTKSNETDFAKYEVYYSQDQYFTPDPASLFKEFNSATSRSCMVDNLLINTTYYFLVRVVDTFGLKNDSNLVNATTVGPDLPPRALILGEPQNVTRTSAELFWSLCNEKDFNYYEVHKSEKLGFKPTDSTRVIKITDKNMTTYNVTGLKMSTEYYFVLRVYDAANQYNDSNEVTAKTKPPNELPIAEAGPDINAYTTDSVELNGVGTDPDGTINMYEWDFEGDGVWDFSNPMTGVIDHIFSQPGIFTATLRVTDNEGATATDTTNVLIEEPPAPNKAPTVSAGPDQTAYVGDIVYFEGSASDADGTITLYEWDFNGDGNYDYSSDSDGAAEYKYEEDGNFKARLRAKDNAGATTTDVALVTVLPKNHAPTAKIARPYDGRKYTDIEFIQFDATGSSDEDGDTMNYKWIDESDGKTLSTKMKFSTQITKLGNHDITLEVSDGIDKGTEQIQITIELPTNTKPTVSISEPSKGATVKGVVIISGRATDTDGTIESVCVRIDGGSCLKATGKTDWSYEWNTASVESGAHTIKAQATDDRGDIDEESITVSVQKKSEKNKGFLGLPGFEAPLMLTILAMAALAVAARRRRDE